MRRRSPREEKILDYIHQTKNSYGENDKGSRKSIRRRKAIVNRVYRRVGKNLARQVEGEEIEVDREIGEETDLALKGQRRLDWVKCSDSALAAHLTVGRVRGSREKGLQASNERQKQAILRLKKKGRWPYGE